MSKKDQPLVPAEYPQELGFLQTHIQQIDTHQAARSPYADVTDEEQHQMGKEAARIYFRQGYQTANSITRKLFIVLRGLPGCGANSFARGIVTDAVSKNVRTISLLSTEDYFINDKGDYVFDKDRLTEYHRLNYKRAIQSFINDTELVILNNYNIKKSHYKHYVSVAQSLGYVIAEMRVGSVNPTDHEVKVYSSNTEGRVPPNVIRKYANLFES